MLTPIKLLLFKRNVRNLLFQKDLRERYNLKGWRTQGTSQT